MIFSAVRLSADQENLKMGAYAQIEMGIDSLQQKYLRPIFNYNFPLGSATIFGEITFLQRAGDQLKGSIDYWLNLGVRRKFSHRISGEIRLNHFCRHLSSLENPEILNLNEVLARAWFSTERVRLGLGYGFYTGGNRDYNSLLMVNTELTSIFGSELSFKGELKFRDFIEILYEAELYFSLSESTDLFIRNAKHYEFENTTYIGIRMKSSAKIEEYLDSLKLGTGFYPYFKAHKILAEGEFRMFFFKTSYRRFIFSLDFSAPIIRDNAFWGDFYPENMVYAFNFEYERKLKDKLFLVWYSRYCLNLPLDHNERFNSDLGTGISLRNQSDFDLLAEKIRFEVSAGYNFDLDFDFGLKFGLNLLNINWLDSHCELRFQLNTEKLYSSLRLFLEFGKVISIRPFIRFDKTSHFESQEPSNIKFLFGIALFKWYGE